MPAVVRNKALAVGATRWLDELPALIASLEREWHIVVGRPFADATEAFVAEVTLDDGTCAVLKLIVPRAGDAAANEITVLRLTGGAGSVASLALDRPRTDWTFWGYLVAEIGFGATALVAATADNRARSR